MGWFGDLLQDVRDGDILFVVAFTLLVGYLVWKFYFWRRGTEPHYRRFFGLTLQIGVTLMLERLYEFSRAHVQIGRLTAVAYSNAYMLVNWEIDHGIFFEQRLQAFFLPDHVLMNAIDAFYAFAHLFVTLGFLIWLYVRRNEVFGFVRNLLYLTTGVALIVYMVFPTSPPRMFSNLGFVDPAVLLGSAASNTQVTSYTYNPFAAMPSLHLVYALIVGCTLVAVGRRPWLRALGAIYPVIMLAVILISANHWILDAVGAVVVVTGSALILAGVRRLAVIASNKTGYGSGGRSPSPA
ncbi:MAG TPA: phosphatase PAP2 family protein [Chloroflexota bacterium]|nr:phosphatase PAP2 family protein [Chloroflexota bacterium]